MTSRQNKLESFYCYFAGCGRKLLCEKNGQIILLIFRTVGECLLVKKACNMFL